jgi:Flp pilus assembly protein TadB
MSRERARRREEREREQAIRTAARARADERRQRAVARRRSLGGLVPRSHRRPGVLAARERRQVWVTVAVLLAVNVVTWVVSPAWSVRTVIAMVSLLAAPVLHTLLFRRR